MLQNYFKDSILGFENRLGPNGLHGNALDITICVSDGNQRHTPEQEGKKETQVVIVVDGAHQHARQGDDKHPSESGGGKTGDCRFVIIAGNFHNVSLEILAYLVTYKFK